MLPAFSLGELPAPRDALVAHRIIHAAPGARIFAETELDEERPAHFPDDARGPNRRQHKSSARRNGSRQPFDDLRNERRREAKAAAPNAAPLAVAALREHANGDATL